MLPCSSFVGGENFRPVLLHVIACISSKKAESSTGISFGMYKPLSGARAENVASFRVTSGDWRLVDLKSSWFPSKHRCGVDGIWLELFVEYRV